MCRTGLDLLRLISLSSPLPESLPALLEVVHDTSGPAKEQETNSMLAFRALANLFVRTSGKSLVTDEAVEVRFLVCSCSTLALNSPLSLCRLSRR